MPWLVAAAAALAALAPLASSVHAEEAADASPPVRVRDGATRSFDSPVRAAVPAVLDASVVQQVSARGFRDLAGQLVGDGGGVGAVLGARGAVLAAEATDPRHALALRFIEARRGDASIAHANGALPLADAERVERASYARGALREVYELRGDGVELLLELDARPAGEGPLVVAWEARTGLAPRPFGVGEVAWVLDDPATGAPVLTIGDVHAFDANGIETRGEVVFADGRLELLIDGAWLDAAAYPVVIDPLVGSAISVRDTGSPEAPDVAHSVTSDGLIVVWSEQGGVKAQRYERNGVVSGPVFDIELAGTGALTPSVAWLELGDQYLVAYQFGTGISARRVPAAAGAPSARFTVFNDASLPTSRPVVGGRLGGAAGDRWFVGYQLDFQGFDFDVRFSLVSDAGVVVAPGVVLETAADDMRPHVNKLAGAGQPWMVALQTDFFGDFDVGVRTISNAGLGGGATQVFPIVNASNVHNDDTEPRIAGLGPTYALSILSRDFSTNGNGTLFVLGDIDGTTATPTRVGSFGAFNLGATTPDQSSPLLSHANTSNAALTNGEYLIGFRESAQPLFPGFPTTPQLWVTRTSATSGQVVNGFLERNPQNNNPIIFSLGNSVAAHATGRRAIVGAGRHAAVYRETLATGAQRIAMRRVGELPSAQVEHPAGSVLGFDRIEAGHHRRGGALGTTKVTLRSTGLGDARVSGATLIQVPPGPNAFALVTVPTTVPAGGVAEIELSYDPQVNERTEAALQVSFDDVVGGPFQFDLTGRAADAAAAIDSDNPPTIAASGTTNFPLVSSLAGVVDAVTLHLDLEHAALAGLSVVLEAPGGQSVIVIAAGALAGADLIGTTLVDGAPVLSSGAAPYTSTFAPSQPLSALQGSAAGGTWTLRVINISGQAGRLQGFSLEVLLGVSGMVVRDGAGVQLPHQGVLRLGLAEVGQVASSTLTVDNTGIGPLTLGAGTTISGPDAASFQLLGYTAQAVPGGQSAAFAVALAPTSGARGSLAATLELAHDDPAFPNPFLVALTGAAPDHVVDPSGLPAAIPDPGVLQSTIDVTATGTLAAARVHLAASHPDTSDIEVDLVSPSGTTIRLFTRRGGARDLFDVVFDDQAAQAISQGQNPFAGSFRPEETLQLLSGEPLSGTWTLVVRDQAAGDVGSLSTWGLELDVLPPGPGIAIADTVTGQALVSGSQLFLGHAATGGGQRQRQVTVRNFGTADLVLGSLGSAAPFAVAPSGGVTVAPGASEVLTVTFAPTANGAAAGQVTFTHNAPNLPAAVSLALTGVGASAAAAIDPASPAAIPDNAPAGVVVAIPVTTAGVVRAMRVNVDAAHSATGDLTLRLAPPGGAAVTLFQRRGGSGADLTATRFDDAAAGAIATGQAPFTGSFRPEEPLVGLSGELAAGTWTLTVIDGLAGGVGAVLGASLEVEAITGRALRVRESTGEAVPSGGVFVFEPEVLGVGGALRSLVFDNLGGEATTLQQASLVGGQGSFTRTGPLGAGLQTLAASGGATTLDVRFEPRVLGAQAATLTVNHNAQNQAPPFQLALVGRGVSGKFAPAQPLAVPDASVVGANAVASVPSTGTIQDVRVNVDLQHPSLSDVTLRVRSPQGTTVTLVQNPAGAAADLTGTTFDDGAQAAFGAGAAPHTGAFRPSGQLADFVAESAFGDWTLAVVDNVAGGTGALLAWSIEVEVVPLGQVALRVATAPDNVTSNQPFGQPLAVEVIDAAGLRVTADSTTRIAVTRIAGPGTLGGTLTRTVRAGVAVFDDLTLSALGSGYVLEATAIGLASTQTAPFVVGFAGSGGQLVLGRSDRGGGGGGCSLGPNGPSEGGGLSSALILIALFSWLRLQQHNLRQDRRRVLPALARWLS